MSIQPGEGGYAALQDEIDHPTPSLDRLMDAANFTHHEADAIVDLADRALDASGVELSQVPASSNESTPGKDLLEFYGPGFNPKHGELGDGWYSHNPANARGLEMWRATLDPSKRQDSTK